MKIQNSENMDNLVGTLNICIGSMYAGKSTKLINIYNEYEDVLVLTHSFENRYSDEELSTHSLIKIPCIKCDSIEYFISNYKDKIKSSNTILIDEGQFFKDIMSILTLVETYGKHVTVFGLDGDFKRNKFGNILDLIPYCDNIEKLHAICKLCNKKAIFSHRNVSDKTQLLVGSTDIYSPLCRSCYVEKQLIKTI